MLSEGLPSLRYSSVPSKKRSFCILSASGRGFWWECCVSQLPLSSSGTLSGHGLCPCVPATDTFMVGSPGCALLAPSRLGGFLVDVMSISDLNGLIESLAINCVTWRLTMATQGWPLALNSVSLTSAFENSRHFHTTCEQRCSGPLLWPSPLTHATLSFWPAVAALCCWCRAAWSPPSGIPNRKPHGSALVFVFPFILPQVSICPYTLPWVRLGGRAGRSQEAPSSQFTLSRPLYFLWRRAAPFPSVCWKLPYIVSFFSLTPWSLCSREIQLPLPWGYKSHALTIMAERKEFCLLRREIRFKMF